MRLCLPWYRLGIGRPRVPFINVFDQWGFDLSCNVYVAENADLGLFVNR